MKVASIKKSADGYAVETEWHVEGRTDLFQQRYSNGMMGLLTADLGEDAAEYESLIAEVGATHTPPTPEPMTPEQLHAMVVQAAQQRLDDFAKTRNYDGILSACTYATSTMPKFATEGQYAVQARDATWAALYALLADVQAGMRPVPASFADVEPMLPPLEWPQ